MFDLSNTEEVQENWREKVTLVRAAGFEPAISSSPTKCSTRLSHALKQFSCTQRLLPLQVRTGRRLRASCTDCGEENFLLQDFVPWRQQALRESQNREL